MTSPLYHYTNTARLPWILHSGNLVAGRGKIGAFPQPDFVWATNLPIVDRTSSSVINYAQVPRDKRWMLRDVRFILRPEDFAPWELASDAVDAWTPAEMRRLERYAAGRSSPKNWFIRLDPLPRERWTALETRGPKDRDWVPLALDTDLIEQGDYLGVVVAGMLYASERVEQPSGAMGYGVSAQPWPPAGSSLSGRGSSASPSLSQRASAP